MGFLLIPLYTHYLSPKDYGVLEMLDLTGNILSFFVAMGITNSILRFYGYYNTPEDREEVINTALIFAIMSGGLLVGFLCLFSDNFSRLLFDNNEYSFFFVLVFINIYLSQVHTHCKTSYRVKNQAVSFTVISVVTTVLALSLNILFIAYYGLGIKGLYYASLITFSITTILLLIRQFYSTPKISFSFPKLLEMLKYGIYFIPTLLIAFVINFSDRYFLRYFTDLETVGLYSLGYKLGMIIFFLMGQSFQQAWGAYAFQYENDKEAPLLYGRIFTIFMFISIYIAFSMALLSKEIVVVIADPRYIDAYKVIPLIAFAAVCYASDNITKIGILITKKTALLPIINFSIATLNVFLNILLIPRYGMLGAAIATAVSFSLLPIISLAISNRFYRIDWEYAKILKLISVSLLLYASVIFIEPLNWHYAVPIKLFIIVFLFPVALFVSHFFTKDDIIFIKSNFKLSRI